MRLSIDKIRKVTVILLLWGLAGCVPEHDVIIVNSSKWAYEVQILTMDNHVRAKALAQAGKVVSIDRAVRKAGKNDTFFFRFKSKQKQKEMVLSWRELLERQWIVAICD